MSNAVTSRLERTIGACLVCAVCRSRCPRKNGFACVNVLERRLKEKATDLSDIAGRMCWLNLLSRGKLDPFMLTRFIPLSGHVRAAALPKVLQAEDLQLRAPAWPN